MSWTPDIMIMREDYERIKDDMPGHEKFTFNINDNDFIVICSGETTSAHRETHGYISSQNISHWIINGEGKGCEDCITWKYYK